MLPFRTQFFAPLLFVAGSAAAQTTADVTARSCHSSTYAPAGVIVFGGARFCGTALIPDSSLWAWNGSRWRALPAPFHIPREDAIIVFDGARNAVLLFGGRTRERVHSDLWEWRDSSWQRLSADGAGPPALEHAAGAFDEARRTLVIFGGAARGSASTSESPVWEWNGQSWRAVRAPGPPARIGPSMTYSRRDGGVLVYGGFNDQGNRLDLWRWDGQRWTQLDARGPTPTEGSALVASDSGVIVFGAGQSSEQPWTLPLRGWIWRGNAWSSVGDPGPPVMIGQSIVYDAGRRRVVLVGGAVPNQQLPGRHWELADGRWVRIGQ